MKKRLQAKRLCLLTVIIAAGTLAGLLLFYLTGSARARLSGSWELVKITDETTGESFTPDGISVAYRRDGSFVSYSGGEEAFRGSYELKGRTLSTDSPSGSHTYRIVSLTRSRLVITAEAEGRRFLYEYRRRSRRSDGA